MQQQSDQGTKDRSDPHGSPDRSDDRSRGRSINITSADADIKSKGIFACFSQIQGSLLVEAKPIRSQELWAGFILYTRHKTLWAQWPPIGTSIQPYHLA